ncbi:MAG: potassium-transporting ATPase, subunit [Myxococcaceae bacterium]|nr:potassium-transporting ATPase, subunit [Myxococcaceae bacterium]
MSTLRPALVLLALFTFLTGVLYPALVTGVAQALFSDRANGSLLASNTQTSLSQGSRLIGQPFRGPRYFWSRPSATAPQPYNAAASSGSNLGPLHPALQQGVAQRVAVLRDASGDHARVPVDLVTSSASGLDPHISPAGALYQVARVAQARGLAVDQVRKLVRMHIEPRSFGILGEPRVNVLELNLALDGLH